MVLSPSDGGAQVPPSRALVQGQPSGAPKSDSATVVCSHFVAQGYYFAIVGTSASLCGYVLMHFIRCSTRSSVGFGYPTFWCPQGWTSRQERLSLRASKYCAGRTGISVGFKCHLIEVANLIFRRMKTVWKANSSATWTSTGQRGRCHCHTPSSPKLTTISFR